MGLTAEQCQERVEAATRWFLRSFRHVPPERMRWTPEPTTKSALEIAAHCAGYGSGFARVLAARAFPAKIEEFLGPIEAQIAAILTVEAAEAGLIRAAAETVAALDGISDEQAQSTLEMPEGTAPFSFFMTIPADHLLLHAGQIDLLQTCWGDMEVYIT